MKNLLKISAADLGTNTLKVTHATRRNENELSNMLHASDTIRLGAGIEASGRIEDHRINECIRFLKEQEAIGREYGSDIFTGVATEALRIASNGLDLIERIHRETNWRIDIISGDREAELTYLGLMDQLPEGVDCSIVDIGGGSTELVVIQNGICTINRSIPIGSGRLADRYFTSNPPGEEAEQAAIAAAHAMFDALLNDDIHVDSIMLAGGSGLFMNQLIEQLFGDPPFAVDRLRRLATHLAITPAEDTVDRIDIPLARAIILPASVAVGVAVMERFETKMAVGVPSGIRMGLIREYSG